ncbi:MAG: hypothetical protein CYPHOPRED_000353 [Cyphobasidiales sp. Tagirdzhanova-0007]|nr:MAG: hypothetical protein CYPHOPRED_000353 [Cyphobasidiales sp. Tagirdzhanova-0007]
MSNPSSSSTLLLLSESDVSRILEDLLLGEIVRCSYLSAVTSQLKQCSSGFIQLACIGRALYAFSHQNAAINGPTMETPPIQSPLRISIRTPAHDVLFMPSRLVSTPRSTADKGGLPATTIVMDEQNGQCSAIINARALTAVRTAAASALALQLSPTSGTARILLIFGSGLQALWHARLVSKLTSDITEIIIASRTDNDRSRALQEDLKKRLGDGGVQVRLCSIAEAVANEGSVERADIICW